jgi:hypothetical protein
MRAFQERPLLQSNARRLLIRAAVAALILGLAICMMVDALSGLATGPQTQPGLFALPLRIDALANPGLRLRGLIILFAGIAAIRLILTSISSPARRWSLIVGGAVLALTLARELPGFF